MIVHPFQTIRSHLLNQKKDFYPGILPAHSASCVQFPIFSLTSLLDFALSVSFEDLSAGTGLSGIVLVDFPLVNN